MDTSHVLACVCRQEHEEQPQVLTFRYTARVVIAEELALGSRGCCSGPGTLHPYATSLLLPCSPFTLCLTSQTSAQSLAAPLAGPGHGVCHTS